MADEITEYWWEGNDLHTIESGQHFVYTNCVITGRTMEVSDTPGVKIEPMTFVGTVVSDG